MTKIQDRIDQFNRRHGSAVYVAENIMHRPQVGDTITYRPGFGMDPAVQVKVTELGEKNDRDLVSLDDGHWAYLEQIDSIDIRVLA